MKMRMIDIPSEYEEERMEFEDMVGIEHGLSSRNVVKTYEKPRRFSRKSCYEEPGEKDED